MSDASPDRIRSLVDFVNLSPTPWHAVEQAAQTLKRRGFVELDESGEPTSLTPGTCAYSRRGGTLFAFRVGSAPVAEAGFRLVSAHTDSPNLRIKPQPIVRAQGWIRLGVEVYGGVIQATWTDRDLGIAGQVYVRDGTGQTRRLVDLRRPLCRIPNLAIHLNRAVNEDGLKLNPQTQLPAVFALESQPTSDDPLRELLGAELGCESMDILSWDLCLFDLTPPTIGGANGEFVFSARLDNLASSHSALEALCDSCLDGEPETTSVVALFDHEEIGSTTSRGATSRLLVSLLERVARDNAPAGRGGLPRALANSWHVSSDMAHAVHPAWPDKHDAQHMPMLNRGPVIKQNANQRYGTEAETAAMMVRLCEVVEAPYQWFVNRADLACGSTVGPLVAAELGVRTVDVGNPMLSMHSIREMCGTRDHESMIQVMRRFLVGGP